MQVICPAPGQKIQAAQYYRQVVCVCTLISSFRTLTQTSALNRTRINLSNASAPTRALILALLATVSAILSNFTGYNYNNVLSVQLLKTPLPPGIYGDPLPGTPLLPPRIPLLPGIYFGMVLGLAIWFWVSRSAWKILTVLLSTVIAWVAAKFTAEHAFGAIQQMLKEIAAPGNTFPTINFMFAVCGVLGGLVGSTILTFGLSLVCKEFGAFENWARVVMPGTALGFLLELAEKDDKFALHLGTLLPLFLAWQVTVAAIIGYCIVPRSGDGKLAPH